jgi:murein DD-endopeptidase MepM/ murein hydrolase activator NlpD
VDLHEHKKKIVSKRVHQRSGFSLIIVPRYQGKVKKFVITPLKIYTSILIVAVIIAGFFAFSYAYKHMHTQLAQLGGMQLESVTSAQSKELQIVQDELSKNKAELDALKEYVTSLSSLEQQVRDSLKLGDSKVSLDYVLNRSTQKSTLQSFQNLPTSVAQLLTEQTNVTQLAQDREKTLNMLKNAADTYNVLLAETPNLWPIHGYISSGFGWRQNPFGGSSMEFHPGIDICAYYGAPVRAAADGTVESAGWDGGYGNCITIYHRDGIESLYGHLSGFAVKAGEKVKKGQVIGYEGSTGEATGPHVHFEIRVNGTPVNPLTYLQ